MFKPLNLQEKQKSTWSIFWISLIPLIIISIGELYTIFFLVNIASFEDNGKYIGLWTLSKFLLSPTLGMLSDRFCRKKVLIITLAFLVVSAVFLRCQCPLEVALILYSIGSVAPVARAAYCDVHISNQRAPNIINTFIAQAIPWVLYFKLSELFSPSNQPSFHTELPSYLLYFIGILTVLFCYFFFKDARDDENRKLSFNFIRIRTEYGWLLCSRIILAFFLSNTIWNTLQYYLVQQPLFIVDDYFSLSQGLAFLMGCLIARYVDIDNKKMLGFIYLLIAVFSLLLYFEALIEKQENSIRFIFVAFTFFGGIGLPLTFAFFGRKADLHEQGILYGLLESLQTTTDWMGSFILASIGLNPKPSVIMYVMLIISLFSTFITFGLVRQKSKEEYEFIKFIF